MNTNTNAIFEQLKRFKFVVGALIFAAILVAIPITLGQIRKQQSVRTQAAGTPIVVKLTPLTASKNVGERLDIEVAIDTKQQDITAVNIAFSFPQDKLELIGEGLVAGSGKTQSLTTVLNDKTTPGRLRYVGVNPTGDPKNNNNLYIGTLSFNARANGQALVGLADIHVNAVGIPGKVDWNADATSNGTYTIGATSAAKDVKGTYRHVGTCVTGCPAGQSAVHYIQITDQNMTTGAFTGKGYYEVAPTFVWNVTGTATGNSITYHLAGPENYTVDGTGTIAADGGSSGTLTSNRNETANWVWTKQNSCLDKPACLSTNPVSCSGLQNWQGGWCAPQTCTSDLSCPVGKKCQATSTAGNNTIMQCVPDASRSTVNSSVWAIGGNQATAVNSGIYKFDGTTWIPVDGAAIKVAVAPDGTPWAVQVDGSIYRRVNNAWQAVPGQAKDLDVGADSSVWAIGGNQATTADSTIYKYNGNGTWTAVDGAAIRITVGPDGTPWALKVDGSIYRRVNNAWQAVSGQAKDIDIGADGSVWAIGGNQATVADSQIYKYNNGSWIQIDGTGVKVTVAPDGTPWVVKADGSIYRRVNNAWQAVSGQAKDIDANTGITGTAVSLAFDVTGIGNNPQEVNTTPAQPSRRVEIIALNAQNQQAAKVTGQVRFDPSTGLYKGVISLGDIPTGAYLLKVRVNNSLLKQIQGIQNLTANTINSVTTTITLLPGDVTSEIQDQDNRIDLADYNAVISCSKNDCNTAIMSRADLNDDGKVEELDLSLIYAGLRAREGD